MNIQRVLFALGFLLLIIGEGFSSDFLFEKIMIAGAMCLVAVVFVNHI